jgi:hypothetical protein
MHPQGTGPLHRRLLQEQDQPAGQTACTWLLPAKHARYLGREQAVYQEQHLHSAHLTAAACWLLLCLCGHSAYLCGGAASCLTICKISSGVLSASPLRACSRVSVCWQRCHHVHAGFDMQVTTRTVLAPAPFPTFRMKPGVSMIVRFGQYAYLQRTVHSVRCQWLQQGMSVIASKDMQQALTLPA